MSKETLWANYKVNFRKEISEAKINMRDYNIQTILRMYEGKVSKGTIIGCALAGWKTLFKDVSQPNYPRDFQGIKIK